VEGLKKKTSAAFINFKTIILMPCLALFFFHFYAVGDCITQAFNPSKVQFIHKQKKQIDCQII